MKGQANWTPMQKVLYTSLVPVVAVIAGLALFSLVRSEARSAPRTEASPTARAGNPAGDARSAGREAYRDCLKNMGADIGGMQSRSRFSAPPDMTKLREAMAVCRNLIEGGGAPSPTPRRATAPPIA